MHCPVCPNDDTKVIDSRPADDGAAIRRRRSCPECSYRFTTYERLEGAPLLVAKRSGDRQPFDRAKVIFGVLEHLKALDEVAYMRFASVYKNFDDAADFRRELALLKQT